MIIIYFQEVDDFERKIYAFYVWAVRSRHFRQIFSRRRACHNGAVHRLWQLHTVALIVVFYHFDIFSNVLSKPVQKIQREPDIPK